MIFIYSIELIFLGLGYNNINQANIKIYDNNCLLINKRTYNNRITVCLKAGKKYLLVANSSTGEIIKNLVVIPNISKYYYAFNNAYYMGSVSPTGEVITFLLVDNNYANLPIEKGEMMVWQRQ